ncbi:hypothetical protein MRX96_026094 [Rhipicephalus microplus]
MTRSGFRSKTPTLSAAAPRHIVKYFINSNLAILQPKNKRARGCLHGKLVKFLGNYRQEFRAFATVEASTGRLVGTTVSTQGGGQVHLWQGVPYALSTAGQRRFASPVALNDTDKCEAVLALQPQPPCAQWVNGQVLGSEDCLYLNVWAPAKGDGESGKRPLVMAATGHWFQRSTIDVPQWAELAAKGNVDSACDEKSGVFRGSSHKFI